MAAKSAISVKDMGTNRIINIGNGVAPQDAAAYGQVQAAQSASQAYTDSSIAAFASGQVAKGAVRAAVDSNINIAAPGTVLDGLTAAAGQIFLLTGQTDGTQNGPWVWNATSTPMTRATNWDTAAEAVVGSYWIVNEGTYANRFALLTNDTFTLGTTSAAFYFTPITMGAGTNGFAGPVPATTAGGTATVTHNLNTQDILVQIRRTISPFDFVDVRVDAATVNTISVLPDVAIASGEFRALIRKVIDA